MSEIRIFLSYASEDRETADKVESAIKVRQWSVDFATYNYATQPMVGCNQVLQIKEQMKTCSHAILILSQHSVKKQGLIALEARTAHDLQESGPVGSRYAFAVSPHNEPIGLNAAWTEIVGETVPSVDHIERILNEIEADAREFPRAQEERSADDIMPLLDDGQMGAITKAFVKVHKQFGTASKDSSLLVLFLGDRLRDSIPTLDDQPFSSEEERFALIRDKLDHRCLRKAAVRDLAIRFRPERGGVPSKVFSESLHRLKDEAEVARECLRMYLTAVEAEGEYSNKWAHLLAADAEKRWVDVTEKGKTAIVIPLRYVPSPQNRDVFGFLIPLGVSQLGGERWMQVNTAIQKELVPCLQMVRIRELHESLKVATTRQQVQADCLDAALALSGADWGCIKSGCIGVGNESLVSAECVYHCPRFYDEGAYPEADGKISEVIRKGHDAIIELGNDPNDRKPHPAREAFVALVRDSTPEGLTRLEPRLQGQQNIVGAFVLQHINARQMSDNRNHFESLIQDITKIYATRLATLAQEETSRSTELLRKDIRDGKVQSLRTLVEEAVAPHRRTKANLEWILLDVDQMGKPKVLLTSHPERAQYLISVSGLGLGNEPYKRSLLFSACNSRNPLFVGDILKAQDSRPAKRRVGHDLEASAWFNLRFEDLDEDELRGAINLGKHVTPYGQNSFSVLVIPIVFTSGLPVGALVLGTTAASSKITDDDIDQLFEHESLMRVARILYQKRHEVQVTVTIRDKDAS